MNTVTILVIATVFGAHARNSEAPETSPELEAATIELIEAVENGNDEVSRRAIQGLIALGPYAKAAVPTLRGIVENKTDQCDAIRALGAIGPSAKGATDCLVTALGRYRESDAARESLIQIGPCPTEVARLVALLDDNEPRIRCNAVNVLATYGKAAKPAVPNLIHLLRENRREHRCVSDSAGRALAGLRSHAVPFLVNALTDDNYNQERRLIVYMLGGMGQDARQAIPALKSALNDPDEQVRLLATRSIRLIEGSR